MGRREVGGEVAEGWRRVDHGDAANPLDGSMIVRNVMAGGPLVATTRRVHAQGHRTWSLGVPFEAAPKPPEPQLFRAWIT